MKYSTILIMTIFLFSCSKDAVQRGTASLTIVNAVAGDTALILTLNNPDTVILTHGQLLINHNSAQQFNSYCGDQLFHLHQFTLTTAVSVYPALFNVSLNMPQGSINSLFLTGTMTSPDTLFVRDSLPSFQTSDSSMGIRFVNLSAGSKPVNIDVQGANGGNEVNSLAYKEITGFKKYPANSAIGTMVFEIRDAEAGTLLATCSAAGINAPGTSAANVWRNRNHTLVFGGLPGSNIVRQSAFMVNNY